MRIDFQNLLKTGLSAILFSFFFFLLDLIVPVIRDFWFYILLFAVYFIFQSIIHLIRSSRKKKDNDAD